MSLPARSVCLDAQGAQSPEHHDRGIARYIVEHVRGLERVRPDALHSVLLNPMLPLTGNLNWLLGSGRMGWATGDGRVARRPRRQPAIYHVMSPFELQRSLDELWPYWARGSDVRTVVTLYDLIPLVFSEHYLRDPVLRARYQTRVELVRRADHVLAISQTTANDAMKLLGVEADRITVVDAGATEKFSSMYTSPDAAWRVLATTLPSIRPGFVLYVAGFEFRKNLRRLIEAYGLLPAELRASHQLVIACRMLASEADLVRDWAAGAAIEEDQLVITGYVTDAELGALYHACSLFLFASIYEGSGLPILEAMSCGAPVVASNSSTGAEILGDLEGTFDPYDPASIADCLRTVIQSPATMTALVERSRRRVATYTWDAVAERSLQAYEEVVRRGCSPKVKRRRARIAVVTPWPPERSGIADYNLRLIRELGKKVDVDVVVGGSLDEYAPPLERGVQLVQSDLFRRAEGLRQPDRVVYCMGNSSFHRHVYELLRERPGLVVAHDVRLTGFYGWFAGLERPEDPAGRLAERIEALYAHRLKPAIGDEQSPSWSTQSALGIYMTREIQQYAEELFVHSRHAADVLELDRGTLDRQVPVAVLPFGMPPTNGHRSCRDLETSPLVISVGVVSEVKGLASLITAISLVAEEREDLRLVIAGGGEPAELHRWRAFARDVAPRVNIEILGHVSATRYEELLREADVAVQLRTLSNGEASAAVADCLAAGLPTIASDLGWASELPGSAVAHLPPDVAPTQLAERLDELIGDKDQRQALSDGALELARECDFAHVADEYLRALELA